MLKLLKSKKGVTLVELLAVVVILGIIAAIAVPTIGGLIERQEERAAESTFTSIEEAARLYAEDDTPFQINTLVSSDFIDLKDNLVTITEAGDTFVNVWIVVDGNTVNFFESQANALAGTPTVTLYVNGFQVYPAA
ncbi:MAG TPA: type II secretion system protein [Acholeplasmataceae bacterium]|nr:type II secretion system protein [Acholeplasmataceae bacterium]HRX44602.1 type II secretion system protein [Acholeplasmataceae bacterium]